MGDIFDEVEKKDVFDTVSEDPSFVESLKETAKSNLLEPVRIAGEVATAPVNAVVKAGKGYYGIYEAAKALYNGKSFDEAIAAGEKAIGDRNAIESPFGQSKLSKTVETALSPAIEGLSSVTGQPELVQGAVEAAGDIASLPGIGSMGSAVKGSARNIYKSAPDSGISFLNPEKLYGSAAKMPLSKDWVKALGADDLTKRKEAIRVGLESGAPVSEIGILIAREKEKMYRTAVDDIVSELDKTGQLVPKEELKQGLAKANKIAEIEGTDLAESIVNRLYDDRFNKKGVEVQTGVNPDGTPILSRMYKPSEIQEIKKLLYNIENYDSRAISQGIGDLLKETGNKGLAHRAKEILESMHPELKRLNREDGAYINLINALERAVPRIENRDLGGLGFKILLAGTHPGMAMVEHVLGIPAIKSKMAIALNKARSIPRNQVAPDVIKATGYGEAGTVANDIVEE